MEKYENLWGVIFVERSLLDNSNEGKLIWLLFSLLLVSPTHSSQFMIYGIFCNNGKDVWYETFDNSL